MDNIKLTPIAGGRNDISGVCSILEIGPFTLLLDCGCALKNSNVILNKLKTKLNHINKTIDAVILSHADLQHLGALPVVFGRNGLSVESVVCTLPVHKFGQLVLYDYCSNKDMEGTNDNNSNNIDNNTFPTFDYDDIDNSFFNPTVVKFSQSIQLHNTKGNNSTSKKGDREMLTLCAYPSGRTIGGSIWRIKHGSTEIVYAIDYNMKNEVVLTGASLDPLPSIPSLLIMDAGSSVQYTNLKASLSSSTTATSNTTSTGGRKKREPKEDPQLLINTILDTLRGDGNVLIPCETAGRTLELLQILGTYWMSNKIGMYHLIFLSPMSYNILEFARSQLEWMSNTLSKQFYNGGANPYDLGAYLKICTSIRELEKLYIGM